MSQQQFIGLALLGMVGIVVIAFLGIELLLH
jgi:hypothetical protein